MKRPYQDVWRDGKLVADGRRETAGRYEAIRGALESRLGRGFSVVDIGGWDGYFPIRLHEDLGCEALNIDTRHADVPAGVEHRRMRVDSSTVGHVGRHDAILALSALHHMPDWREVYAALKGMCTLLIVEACHPAEVDRPDLSPTMRRARDIAGPLHEAVSADALETLHETPPLDAPDLLRPTFLVRCAALGTVEDGTGKAAALIGAADPGDWSALGYEPYPGTLNVKVGREAREWLRAMPGVTGPTLKRSDHYVPVAVDGYPCHARFSRAWTVVELVAPVRLRDELDVADGQVVEVRPR